MSLPESEDEIDDGQRDDADNEMVDATGPENPNTVTQQIVRRFLGSSRFKGTSKGATPKVGTPKVKTARGKGKSVPTSSAASPRDEAVASTSGVPAPKRTKKVKPKNKKPVKRLLPGIKAQLESNAQVLRRLESTVDIILAAVVRIENKLNTEIGR